MEKSIRNNLFKAGLVTILLLVIINISTWENNIPADGIFAIGFPWRFFICAYDPIGQKYTYTFSILGIITNLFIAVMIFLAVVRILIGPRRGPKSSR